MIKEYSNVLTSKEAQKVLKLLEGYPEAQVLTPPFYKNNFTVPRTEKKFDFVFKRLDCLLYKTLNEKRIAKEFYVLSYSVGSKIEPHNDIWNTDRSKMREYTLVVQLCKSSEYEGGELNILNPHNYKLPRNLGSGVLFKSEYQHEVTEVTKGVRKSLVICYDKKIDII